jgi:hypothetical protein
MPPGSGPSPAKSADWRHADRLFSGAWRGSRIHIPAGRSAICTACISDGWRAERQPAHDKGPKVMPGWWASAAPGRVGMPAQSRPAVVEGHAARWWAAAAAGPGLACRGFSRPAVDPSYRPVRPAAPGQPFGAPGRESKSCRPVVVGRRASCEGFDRARPWVSRPVVPAAPPGEGCRGFGSGRGSRPWGPRPALALECLRTAFGQRHSNTNQDKRATLDQALSHVIGSLSPDPSSAAHRGPPACWPTPTSQTNSMFQPGFRRK